MTVASAAKHLAGGPTPGADAMPLLGAAQTLRLNERAEAERIMDAARKLRLGSLRLAIPWSDWAADDEARAFYAWALPFLARELEVVPALVPAGDADARGAKAFARPRTADDWLDCVACLIEQLGPQCAWIELNARAAPDLHALARAMERARDAGKRVAISGRSDLTALLAQLGSETPGAVALQLESERGRGRVAGWAEAAQNMRTAAGTRADAIQLWGVAAGRSNDSGAEARQVAEIAEALGTPLQRFYWSPLLDRAASGSAQLDGLGLLNADGRPRLAARLLAGGGPAVLRRVAALRSSMPLASAGRRWNVITGGAGFVGTNLADRLAELGERVLLLDNVGRAGVEENAAWLKKRHGDLVALEVADIRDPHALQDVIGGAQAVFHLAAQVAVTTSIADPANDFEINARGTLNVLEAVRTLPSPPPLVFTSTNKVYGCLQDIELEPHPCRYAPRDPERARFGVDESQPLDFRSPYGCSKGAADQYVLDYARIFKLPAVVFRMSCIYGPRQFGTEDQGWVAHFLRQAMQEQPITIFGDGRQVRDLLFVGDLVDAFLLARHHVGKLQGRAFNIGGGPERAVSLLQLIEVVHEIAGREPAVRFGPWRPDDQRYYVSDTRRFEAATGWRARTDVRAGVSELWRWLHERFPPAAAAPARGAAA